MNVGDHTACHKLWLGARGSGMRDQLDMNLAAVYGDHRVHGRKGMGLQVEGVESDRRSREGERATCGLRFKETRGELNTASDGSLDEGVKLLVSTNGKLQVESGGKGIRVAGEFSRE